MTTVKTLLTALGLAFAAAASATGLGRIRFVVTDPKTGLPVEGQVLVEANGHPSASLTTGIFYRGETAQLDTDTWRVLPMFTAERAPTVIHIPLGTSVTLTQRAQRPVKEITIRVTATRIVQNRAPAGGVVTQRDKGELRKFVDTASGDTKSLTKGQKGVAEDSAGQQHIRGEHAEIAFVIDGIPLPDRLSGGQGSVVVPSTIENLEILTGGYAPEFGGNTAAILNINTLPGAKESRTDVTLEGGDYASRTGDVTSVGRLGRKGSFVFDISGNKTDLAEEPQQPNQQTAHNSGSSKNYFAKFRYASSSSESLALTLSHNPNALQINNRTGLPDIFSGAGQGFGFLGLRNADGTRPDVDSSNTGLLGAAPMLLPSQQADGMDINQQEVDEFATLAWQKNLSAKSLAQMGLTFLHSGQDLTNNNPAIDVMNLPVDNSIEFNPTANRNVHHVQLNGNYSSTTSAHRLKLGFLLDAQSGKENYQLVPASQLALDALAALDPTLVPAGSSGSDVDINGNPVYTPTSGQVPVLSVQRKGTYKAAYVQDTWQATRRFTVNYGFRGDWYSQNQDLGQPAVNSSAISPRLNLTYQWTPGTILHASYNKLFNYPPIAQGAIVGAPIQPEILNQYDIGLEHKVARNQTLAVAYYYKDIHNQVDTGLLVPGSQIGLYSAVNLEFGAVHGVEASYDITSSKGLDLYLNLSHSSAQPNGLDNTGAPVPDYNDHDQRDTVGTGVAYTFNNGATAAVTFQYGSGLASSPVPPSDARIPRSETDIRLSSGDKLFHGNGGLGLDITNLFDSRKVINFESGFSGTRFQMGRKVLLSAFFHF